MTGMKMNTPNKLTVLRIILVPVFMILLLWQFKFHYLAALVVFVAASLTDMFDGKIARKYNIITNFGKFLDPIADKMLTTAAFLAFIYLDLGCGVVWITLIVLIREFAVSSVRMVTASDGKVIAADKWGKAKTVCQMTAIIMVLCFEWFKELAADLFEKTQVLNTAITSMEVLYNIALWLSAILTVISGVNYLLRNRKYIDPSK